MDPAATTSTTPLLDLLFEEDFVGRCLVSSGGSVLRANAEWLRLTGFSLDDVLGASILDLFPETRDLALALHARARAALRVEVPRHRGSGHGRETWWEGSIAPVPMDGVSGLLLTIREARGARRDEEQARAHAVELEAILDCVADGVIVYDREGRTVRSTPAADRILGVPVGERRAPVQDRVARQYEILTEDGRRLPPEEMVAVRASVHGETITGEVLRIRAGQGEPRWISMNAKPLVLDGEHAGAVISMSDITERKRAEQELRRSEERFRAFFNTPAVGAAELGLDGRIGEVNERMCVLTGYSREELLRMTPADLTHPDDRAREDLRLSAYLRGESANYQAEKQYVRKGGEVIWVQVTAGLVADAPGMVPRSAAIVQDITERKLAEDSLRQAVERYERQVRLFDGVASTTPDFVYLFDPRGRFLYANRRLLEVLGMQLPEVIGKTFRELGYEQWHHDMHMREIAQVIETTQPIKGEVPFRAPLTGVFGIYEYIFTPVLGLDGQVDTIAGTTRDVTERKRAEEELRDADKRKTEFLGVLSHELRNPLAPIRNSIYLLERAAPDSEQAARAKEVIRRQTEHLTRLVDDLLDVTRISRGKVALQRRRCELREIARKTVDDLRSVYAEAGVELRLEHGPRPVWIDADATRIAQVLGNLLQNSVKFTQRGGAVVVTVAARQQHAELCVRDDGAGMDPRTIERMFEPFEQADQTLARTQGGLGLGLALVKGLVELHGGTVEARSEGPGRGAEIIVSLPLVDAGAEPARDGITRRERGGKLILVIEDNLDAGRSLADILELNAHRVRVARDGASGLELARELRPDVVLCDIGLPDMNGYEVARALRRDGTAGVRLVALSGYAQPEDRQRAREAGFDAHVAKPPDVDELLTALANDD